MRLSGLVGGYWLRGRESVARCPHRSSWVVPDIDWQEEAGHIPGLVWQLAERSPGKAAEAPRLKCCPTTRWPGGAIALIFDEVLIARRLAPAFGGKRRNPPTLPARNRSTFGAGHRPRPTRAKGNSHAS